MPHLRAPAISTFSQVREVVADDLRALNALIPVRLTSDVDLVAEIGEHIVQSGGKRLRPLIVLLAARACGYTCQQHIPLAAVIEFLHTATLLHDDVIDRSDLRRGKATANALWGNAPSVLVGDFLYSRAFQMMVEIGNQRVLSILADATNVIAAGEVLQLSEVGNKEIDETRYRKVIDAKTAMLFEASAHAGAVLTEASVEQSEGLRAYGHHIGMAYQLIDDYLDYAGNADAMGKNVGDDLAEGKVTLPLIHTMRHGSPDDAQLVSAAIDERRAACIDAISSAVRRSGALDYTRDAADRETQLAIESLSVLPESEYRSALEDVARLAGTRDR